MEKEPWKSAVKRRPENDKRSRGSSVRKRIENWNPMDDKRQRRRELMREQIPRLLLPWSVINALRVTEQLCALPVQEARRKTSSEIDKSLEKRNKQMAAGASVKDKPQAVEAVEERTCRAAVETLKNPWKKGGIFLCSRRTGGKRVGRRSLRGMLFKNYYRMKRSVSADMGGDNDSSGNETSSPAEPEGRSGFLFGSKLLGLSSARGASGRKLGKSRLTAEGYGVRPAAAAMLARDQGLIGNTGYREHDAAYFHAYSHIGVHEEMIKDRTRTDTYRDAIFANVESIRDKVVVDVGCGTGILSIFCAFAGARKVYAIDASDIAVQAQEVVKANGLSEIITVILGRVEEVDIPEPVDVIVSEWMGYMLLYESMLPSVICARDRWLKPGGLMLPTYATLYMAPITHSDRYADSIDFWRNVYGIDMSAMLPLAKQCAFEEPCVETITAENVLSWPIVVKHIDCSKVTIKELEVVTANFCVSSMMAASLHGFALWFDVTFGIPQQNSHALSPKDSPSGGQAESQLLSLRRRRDDEPLVLSTAPEESPTHWQQTILYIYDPVEVRQDQVISGSISLAQTRENPRFLNIHLEYSSGDRRCVKESVMR
ncbi:hypothetical protein R1flu_018030 [Riccia fluitans]|uniref:Protein arginine N-methyltransferase domain-containing protein n=1 Tax=Riccia fluitans TaxID=41844 RepID=A0ABD1ZEW0_9MARC